jgi:hypothetical protein
LKERREKWTVPADRDHQSSHLSLVLYEKEGVCTSRDVDWLLLSLISDFTLSRETLLSLSPHPPFLSHSSPCLWRGLI